MTETEDEKAYPGPTLDEWVSYIKAQKSRSDGKVAPDNFHLALQAAVLAENLTGDKHWDYFLQCLQGALEDNRSKETDILKRLGSPDYIVYETLVRLKLSLAHAQGAISTLEWIIALPHKIKEQVGVETAEVAQELPSADPAPA